MDNRDKNMTFGNTVISWGIAGLVGLIAFLLFVIMGEWSLSAAGFGGAVIAIILVILFTIIFGRDLPPLGSVQSPVSNGAARSGSTPAPSAEVNAAVAGGGAAMGGGGAAATSPAATGTPVGQGAVDANERRDADAAKAVAQGETPATGPDTAAAVPEGAEQKPAGLDAPRGGQGDDLKRIKGIGPKLETLCNSMGFWHFDQIAAWTAEEIAWVDENLEGFKGRVTRDEWVSQAKALAAGEETEFSKKVDKGDVY